MKNLGVVLLAVLAVCLSGSVASAHHHGYGGVVVVPAPVPVVAAYPPVTAYYPPAVTYVAPTTVYYPPTAPVVVSRVPVPAVVVRPKVYVVGQPIRNVIRAVTP